MPDGIGRTIEVTDYWFGADVPPEIVQEVLDWDDQVGREDTDLVISVQAGLDSGAVPQGRIMRESEQLLADFQRACTTRLRPELYAAAHASVPGLRDRPRRW